MLQLPIELIELVFSYLLLDLDNSSGALDLERSATLLKFAMACRAFRQLALPHIYYTVSCDHKGPVTPLDILEYPMEQPKSLLLIHELHTEMVKNERREQHEEGALWEYYCRSGPSLQLCKLLLSLDVSDEFREELYGGLQEGFEDAETAMLLCLCKDLRVWKTHVGDRSPKELLWRYCAAGDDSGTFCDSLENKVIRHSRIPGSRLLQRLDEVHVRFEAVLARGPIIGTSAM